MTVRKRLALPLALLGLFLLAPSASASYHLMSVREVAPNPAGPDTAFIELQMYSAAQNLVGTRPVSYYTATGTLLGSYVLPGSVPNGENQRTILIGDTAAAGSPDFVNPTLADALQTYGPGGAVCFDVVDCVSWGAFTGAALLPSPTGTPAAAIPDGSSLERSIAPGCATLLEASDDADVSATDFALATPSPRNNSVTPTEQACGGGGGNGDDDPPQTSITKAPKAKSAKTTAKFKFRADDQAAEFRCKLDKGTFEKCSSPKKYKNLDPGKHRFQVFAVDASGNADRTPAKAKFKIVE